MKLKIKNLPGKRRVLIVKPTKEEHDLRKIYVLMSNDFDSEIPLLLRGWSFRDSIDKFYQRSKDELGFDQYQVRGDRASVVIGIWYFLCIYHISSSMWKFQKVVHACLPYLWSTSGRYSDEVDASFSELVC